MKTKPYLDTILLHLLEVTRPEILRHMPPDSCIASTRIAIDVLDHFGIDTRALKVQVNLGNPAFVRLVRENGFPTNQATMNRWIAEEGAWTLGIGVIPEHRPERPDARVAPGKWPGHLVAVVEGTRLLDLSLDQASRPRRGIVLNPLLVACSAAFLAGEEDADFDHDGCLISYQAFPDDRSWNGSRDWDRSRWAGVTGQIIRVVQGRLEGDQAIGATATDE